MTKTFLTPFGADGDKTPIPVERQSDGSVSYDTGYGADYSRQLGVDPSAKDISRESFNQLLFDVTEAIRDEQAGKVAPWSEDMSTALGGYSVGAIVARGDSSGYWRSMVDGNTVDPAAGSPSTWRPLGVTGVKTLAMTADNTPTYSDAAFPLYVLTGAPAVDVTLTLPAWPGYSWTIDNRCTGSKRVTVKTPTGSGVVVNNERTTVVICDGPNIVVASNSGDGGLPVGSIVPFPKGTVPIGFLEMDGSVQSQAIYPDLFAYLGTTFNTGGEGAGNFRLPDARAEFLRGWDHGRGIDTDRVVGSKQGDALQNITGSLRSRSTTSAGAPGGIFSGAGTFALETQVGGAANSVQTNTNANTDLVTFDASRVARTANETRPRNMAVMYCLKAWNAPVNQGNIDVNALVEELDKLKSSIPVGTIIPFPKSTLQPGYLELDGSIHDGAAYPDLFAYLGTTYNTGGEPTGYFRLPDYRGEFLRGWDHGRGIDAGRTLGSSQLDALQNIIGGFTTRATDQVANDIGSLTGAFGAGADGPSGGIKTISGTTKPTQGVSFDASRVARTAAETRPRNMSVMWCIKAWNAPVNQGTIDIAELAELVMENQVRRIARLSSASVQAVSGTVVAPQVFAPLSYAFTADGSMYDIIVKLNANIQTTSGTGPANAVVFKLLNGATVLDASAANIGAVDSWTGDCFVLKWSGPLTGAVSLAMTFEKTYANGSLSVNGDRDDLTTNVSGQVTSMEIWRRGP